MEIDLTGIRIIYDGEVHRFYVEGDKKGSKNGWYIANSNGFIVYSSWKYGADKHYINEHGVYLSKEDRLRFKKELAIEKHRRFIFQEDAAKIVHEEYVDTVKDFHPYLASKGFAARRDNVTREGLLIIPIIPPHEAFSFSKNLISAQYIYGNGRKRFAKGCRTKGGVAEVEGGDSLYGVIYLCEGYVTGLTISAATDIKTVCSMYASNMLPAYEGLILAHGDVEIIVCPDNDRFSNGNPGITEAMKIQDKYDAKLCIPDLLKCSDKATDFNDIMLELGIDEVRRQINGDSM